MSSNANPSTDSPTEILKADLLKQLHMLLKNANILPHFINNKLRECLLNKVVFSPSIIQYIIYYVRYHNHKKKIDENLVNQLLDTYPNNVLINNLVVLYYDEAYKIYLKKFNATEINTYVKKVINYFNTEINKYAIIPKHQKYLKKIFDNFIINIQTKHKFNSEIEMLLISMNKEYLLNKDIYKLITIYKKKNDGGINGLEKFLKKNQKYHIGETELNFAITNHDINLFNLCLDYKVKLTKESLKLLFSKVKPYFDNTGEKYIFMVSNKYGYRYQKQIRDDYIFTKININKIILEYAKLNFQFSKEDIELFLKNGIAINPIELGIEKTKEIIDLYCKYNYYNIFPDIPEPSQEGLDHLASFVTARTIVNKVCKKHNMKPSITALRNMCKRSNNIRSFKEATNNLITKYGLTPDLKCLEFLIENQGKKALSLVFNEYVKGQNLMKNKIKLENELTKYKTSEVIPQKETKETKINKKSKKQPQKLKNIEDEINDIEDENEKQFIFHKHNDTVKISSSISKLLSSKKTKIKYSYLKDKFIRYIFENDLMNNEEIIIDENFLKLLKKEGIKVNEKLKESKIDTFLNQIILKK